MRIFSGIHKNRSLKTPKSLLTRPTSGRLREALFNICQHAVDECRFLDLFAGSGAMGLEALSRGAAHATFVDHSKESVRCIDDNVRLMKEESRAHIIYGNVFDVLSKLAKQGKQYDIIYADPPYEVTSQTTEGELFHSIRILNIIDQQLDQNLQLLAPGGMLFLEEAAEVSLENISSAHLVLKNSRRMGRSALHFFVRKDS